MGGAKSYDSEKAWSSINHSIPSAVECRACIKTLCLGWVFLEDVLNEELLKVLIGVVDTELFETVRLEIFESENVQHSYCTFITAPENREQFCYTLLKTNIVENISDGNCM